MNDAGGRVVGKTYPDSDTSGFTYDRAGRIKTVIGAITNLTYNARGQTLTADYANGNTASFVYNDDRNWLDSLSVTDGNANELLGVTYTRDDAGRITAMTTRPIASRHTGVRRESVAPLEVAGGFTYQVFQT